MALIPVPDMTHKTPLTNKEEAISSSMSGLLTALCDAVNRLTIAVEGRFFFNS